MMGAVTELESRSHTSEKRWAMLRIVLGIAQTVGATMAFIFLLRTGVNVLSVTTTLATAFVTLLCMWLFAERRA